MNSSIFLHISQCSPVEDISQELIATIFKAKGKAKQETNMK
jgi:hypothetical protein